MTKKINATHIYAFSILVITFLCCLHIKSFDHLVVLNDEFGYWAHAVSALGYDWKELIYETPYYSWGYSLWLIPIIAILPTPELWYKGAILLNVLFLHMSYFLCNKCGRKLFPQISEKLMAIISLLVIIYPSNIAYAQVAWSETLCYFLFWLETYFLIRLDEKFTNKYFLLVLVIPIYSFAVHNRTIGILLTTIITLTLILIKNKKNPVYYFVLFILVAIGYKSINLVKAHQIATIWSNSLASSLNNVGLDSTTINHYTSRIVNEAGLLGLSLIGKFYYLIVSTELLFPVVIVHFFKEVFCSIKTKSKNNNYSLSCLGIFLSVAAMFCICSLQMNQWQMRKDIIVYSRYMENTYGPLLLLIFALALLSVREQKVSLFFSFCYILVTFFPICYFVFHADLGFNSICSPFIGVFFRMIKSPTIVFSVLSIFILFTFFILLLSTSLRNNTMRIVILLLCIGITYSSFGLIWGHASADSRKGYDECINSICNILKQDYRGQELYYVKNSSVDSNSVNPKYIQYAIPNQSIHTILPEEIDYYLSQKVVLMINPNDSESADYLFDAGLRPILSNYLLSIYPVN